MIYFSNIVLAYLFHYFKYEYVHSPDQPCISLTVLMGLELERGEMVDQAVEKQFTGDLRLGLKVLGKYWLGYFVSDWYALSMMNGH